MIRLLCFVVLVHFFQNVVCVPLSGLRPVPTEAFAHHTTLDSNGKFHMFWKSNSTHITFEAHVQTRGYLAFGFSPNGNMYPADVVVGWVKDGKTHFKDRHTVGHSPPLVDASQDWTLLHGEENDFGTVIKTVRIFDTCDSHDYKITNDTVRMIYSFNDHEPQNDAETLTYHGFANRGSKSLMLLSDKKEAPKLPKDAVTKDFLNDKFHVPDRVTTYRCRIFDMSYLGRKHHMIKFEPVIRKGHENLLHHMIVHKCSAIPRSYIGSDYDCYDPHLPHLRPCGNSIMAWAIGGEVFYFPEHTGLPLAEPGDSDLYVLETHYNNVEKRNDYVDDSGFRITMTPTLRQHDAGIFSTGMVVNALQIVPPFEKDFISTAFCTEKCLKQGLDAHPDGVNIIAVLEHAHLLARGIRTRIIRNGTELEPLVSDENYDFNYQDYRYLQQTRTLKSGDSIMVDCKYDSSQKSKVTVGGLATTDEMCLSFMIYYPRMAVGACASAPVYDTINGPNYMYHPNAVKKLFDWSNKTEREEFKNKLQGSKHFVACVGERLPTSNSVEIVPLTKPVTEYNPASSCSKPSTTFKP